MRNISLIAVVLLVVAGLALAAQPILVLHFTFDPTHTRIIESGWRPEVGAPGDVDDNADHGFVLEKNGLTTAFAAGGAVLTGVAGLSADDGTNGKLILGFDILDNTHCGGGAPRFNVTTTGGFFFVGGCGNGTDVGGAMPGWTRVQFVCPGDWFPNACPVASSTVVGIAVIFDEGTDTPTSGGVAGGIVTPGQTVIDNIYISDGNVSTVVGKPGAGPKSE